MTLDSVAAVVTGGMSGLGRATAELLAEAGANVTAVDIVEAPADLGTPVKGKLAWHRADVSNPAEVSDALETARRRFGQERILVNCAGIVVAQSLVRPAGVPHDPDLFCKVLSVNLFGTFLMCSQVAAKLAEMDADEFEERGVIVNTSSVAAFEGRSGQAAYAASKAGVAAMTLPLARDLAPFGIRVVAIAPGLFKTPMFEALSDEGQRRMVEQVPFPRRAGKPREFAELVRHIIENPMLNGEVIRLDGAVRMTHENPEVGS